MGKVALWSGHHSVVGERPQVKGGRGSSMIKIPGVDPVVLAQIQAQTARNVVQEAKRPKVTGDPEREGRRYSQLFEQAEKSVTKLNQAMEFLESPLRFSLVERQGSYLVQIVDSSSGRLLKEVAPEKAIEVVAKLKHSLGVIIDELI